MLLETVTLTSLGLAAFHHAGYPLILKAARRRAVAQRPPVVAEADLPAVTVVMPAYQEEAFIGQKLENLAKLDYPAGKLRILVVSDGCTDKTVALARRKAGLLKTKGFELTVVDNAENRGKVACLNQALGLVESDILAFSDISASLEPDALRRSMAWFNKAEVGVVAGGYALDRPMDEGEAAYWRYQTAVKQGEAALGAPLGVHGAFYAVRTALVEPLAADTINDDFILPMGIVAKGYRAIYDTGIRCAERETATRSMDFRRRQRIAAGNLQQVLRLPGLLISRQVGVAFCFLSGKALRAVMAPLLLIGGLGSAWLSVESMPFAVMTAIGLLGLALAGMGHAKLPLPKRLKRISAALAYLIAGHTAGLIGLMRFLAGGYRTPWVRASQASTQPLRASQ